MFLASWLALPAMAGPPTCHCPTTLDPVCGEDRVTYANACLAGKAGASVDFHAPCDAVANPGELAPFDLDTCTFIGGVYPLAGENHHLYAVRLPVDGDPYLLTELHYALIDSAGIANCNGSLAHRVELYVQSADLPQATPVVVFSSAQTPVATPGVPNEYRTISLPTPLVIDAGENLFVSFEMIYQASTSRLCVQTCETGGFTPSADVSWWSNAAAPPYPWADMWLDFGIGSVPYVWTDGYRLIDAGWDPDLGQVE